MNNAIILNDLIRKLGLSISKFERIIGVGPSTIGKAIERKSKISTDIALKIKTAFPQVNDQWLKTGEGEIFKTPHTENTRETSTDPTDYLTKYIALLETRVEEQTKALAEKEKAFDVLAEQSKAITRLLEINLSALANDMNVVLAKAAVQLQVSTFHYSKLAGISRKEAEIETDSVIAEIIGASGVKGS